ncbi:MAG: J domain-containing protein [Anaerolineae bacterium]|nr:J domain-containing protein [Anaerolineae bacterium]
MSSEPTTPPTEPELKPDLHSQDPYAVLGLTHEANERQIKRAYFTLVRTYSPETEPAAFKKMRAAYEQLRHTDTKKETDLSLFQPPLPWTPRKRLGRLYLSLQPDDLLDYLALSSELNQADFPKDYRPIQL